MPHCQTLKDYGECKSHGPPHFPGCTLRPGNINACTPFPFCLLVHPGCLVLDELFPRATGNLFHLYNPMGGACWWWVGIVKPCIPCKLKNIIDMHMFTKDDAHIPSPFELWTRFQLGPCLDIQVLHWNLWRQPSQTEQQLLKLEVREHAGGTSGGVIIITVLGAQHCQHMLPNRVD